MPLTVPSPTSLPQTLGVRRAAGSAVELIAPDQLPFRRVACVGLVVGERHLDALAAVLAVVPEVQPARIAPVLADREGAAEPIGGHALLLGDLRARARRRPGRGAPGDRRPRSPGWSASPCPRSTRDTGRSRSRRAASGRSVSLSWIFTRAIGGRPSAAPPVGLDSSTSTPRSPWYLASSIVCTVNDCWVTFGAKVSVPDDRRRSRGWGSRGRAWSCTPPSPGRSTAC